MCFTNARSNTHTPDSRYACLNSTSSWILNSEPYNFWACSVNMRKYVFVSLHTKYAGCLCLCVLCVFVSWMVVSYLLHTHIHTTITHYPCVPERVRSHLNLYQRDLRFDPRYFYTVVPSWRRYAWPVEVWMRDRVRVITEVRMDYVVRGVNDCVSVLWSV